MKIALIGNQNSGKTTLFNALTGSNQKVGNWPGVTIERKEGKIKGTDLTIVDLPGVYSLSPYTPEEEVSRQYAIEEKPDLIINIIDASCIERSLYLTTQLLELDSDVIVALNMSDTLEKKGITIDVDKLSALLMTSVIKVSALKGTGINELLELLVNKSYIKNEHKQIFPKKIEDIIELSNIHGSHKRFVSVKMIENDPCYFKLKSEEVARNVKSLELQYGYDIEQIIANERYNYIDNIKKDCVIEEEKGNTITDKLDKIFLNKWASIPIFAIIMAAIYILAVGVVGGATVDLVSNAIDSLKNIVENWLLSLDASDWAVSLVCDGVISGVGAVLNFIPQLMILFLCISILETSGYMNRIAFFLDKVFRKFGLNGKSLIPFIVGSGCSVPGIMAARTIEDEEEKALTIMTTSFIPCSAKLPIIALFAGYFFDGYSGLVTFSLYLMAIIVILISAVIMKKLFFNDNNSAFITELPEYKLPSIKYVLRDVLEKSISFVKRAGTIILLCSVVVWFLLSFGWDFWNGLVTSVENSMLADIGNCFAWFFYPFLGEWSWAAAVSAIQGLAAKELVVSSMNIIAGLSEESQDYTALFNSNVFSFFNGASAYAYCVFCLFSAPCFGAIGAMRKELGSTKRMLQAVVFQTAIAWILAVIVFCFGSLFLI